MHAPFHPSNDSARFPNKTIASGRAVTFPFRRRTSHHSRTMKTQILAGVCLILATLLSLHNAQAQPKATPAGDTAVATGDSATGAGKVRAVPFQGVIAALDERARTFTITGKGSARSFKITETTVITRAEQAATMKDIVANEEVRGSYYKMPDGSLEAKTVKLGPLTEAEQAVKDARKEKRDAKKASASATP